MKQQLLVLLHLVSSQILIVLVNNYILQNLSYSGAYLLFLMILCVQALPTLMLHFQYLRHDSGCELLVDLNTRIVSYSNATTSVEFAFDDIKQLQFCVSFGRHTGVYSFAFHRYFKIILHNGAEVIITCLMMNDIENTLPLLLKNNFEEKPKVFCFLPLKRKWRKG